MTSIGGRRERGMALLFVLVMLMMLAWLGLSGMRMAGQMGNERVTVLNLEVVRADVERNLLLLKGAVPGPNGGLVMVRSAVKAPLGKGGR